MAVLSVPLCVCGSMQYVCVKLSNESKGGKKK